MSLLLFHASLDGTAGAADCLDEAERLRVARKRDALQRQRQQAALVFVRQCLARHCDLDPAQLPLCRAANGKPQIDPVGWQALGRSDPPPQYSLSHCGGHALLAIADCAVGVDLEARIQQTRPALAARVLAAEAFQAWQALDPDQQIDALTVAWVRKEAVLKASGLGLGFGLRRLEPGWGDGPVRIDLGRHGCWQVHDVEAPEGHRAALALPAEGLHTFQ